MTINVNAITLDVDASSISVATITVRASDSVTGQQVARDILVQIPLNATAQTAISNILARAVNKAQFRFSNAATVRQSDPNAIVDITQAVSGEPS